MAEVIAKPVAMNTTVATIERSDRREMPQTPCPDVQPLPQLPQAAFKGCQALPKEAPAVGAHSAGLQRAGCEPARIHHVDAKQDVGF